MKTELSFAALVQAYFTERLVGQRNASPHTIASHRDTFRLLLGFAQKTLKKAPAALAVSDLDAPFIGRFLHHVEKDRGNKPQTRNIRLAAIHSFFHYVALQEPSLSALAQRVLAIPSKRHKTRPVDFLTREEIDALVAAPTRALGPAAGTALCCWWRCKPACGPLNSSGCVVMTWYWEPVPTCGAWAKAAKSVVRPCARMRSLPCAAGSQSATANPPTSSFPMPKALH
jgi:hypothetical protein